MVSELQHVLHSFHKNHSLELKYCGGVLLGFVSKTDIKWCTFQAGQRKQYVGGSPCFQNDTLKPFLIANSCKSKENLLVWNCLTRVRGLSLSYLLEYMESWFPQTQKEMCVRKFRYYFMLWSIKPGVGGIPFINSAHTPGLTQLYFSTFNTVALCQGARFRVRWETSTGVCIVLIHVRMSGSWLHPCHGGI